MMPITLMNTPKENSAEFISTNKSTSAALSYVVEKVLFKKNPAKNLIFTENDEMKLPSPTHIDCIEKQEDTEIQNKPSASKTGMKESPITTFKTRKNSITSTEVPFQFVFDKENEHAIVENKTHKSGSKVYGVYQKMYILCSTSYPVTLFLLLRLIIPLALTFQFTSVYNSTCASKAGTYRLATIKNCTCHKDDQHIHVQRIKIEVSVELTKCTATKIQHCRKLDPPTYRPVPYEQQPTYQPEPQYEPSPTYPNNVICHM